MDIEEKIEIIKREPTEEIITEEDLKNLLQTNSKPKHYIGFEISGYLHLGTLIICGDKVNDLIEAGFDCTIYLADWHSFLNNKLKGNWDNIIKASNYYKEAFSFYVPKAKIILGSEFYYNNNEYWKDVVKFASQVNLTRIRRSLTILGRSEKENLAFAHYLYPIMQAVDVKYLGEDLAHGGMDQRKIHVLCREIFPKLKWKKPIALHHHLLLGLSEPPKVTFEDKTDFVISLKMSKSKPYSAIFIHDDEETIKKKILKAWCPEKSTEINPILEMVRYIILRKNKEFLIERESKYGGDIIIGDYKELETMYKKGEIHPLDLKLNVAREINKIIEPIRKHFEIPQYRKLLEVFEETAI